MANSSNNRRQAANRFELVYSSGGTGGPYDNEYEAKKAAERLLQGGSDRWVAVIDAKDVNDLTKAKALWTLKRGGRWEKGPSPLPNVRPMDHFEEAAKPDPEDEDPEWLERLGNTSDVRKSADDLVSMLEKDPDGELGDLIAAAQAIADNLDDSVETESDFNANTTEALKAAAKLKELLKAAKPVLRKNGLPDSIEIVDEALSDLRGLMKELSELQPMDRFEATRRLRALVVETHAALSEAAPVEADFEMAGTLTRRVLGPVVDNLEKYLNDEDPKTVKVGLGMVFDALASVLDQLGQSTAATATRAARKEVRMGKA